MCGITATYVAQPAGEPVERETLEEQLQESMKTIHHRGPDSTGTYISEDGRVGLGHTRLSIIDVECGQQPLHHLDNTVHAIVNGEIYDYARLREELELTGAVFQTNSDSELVVHLYKVHGINLVHHLRGEFAFALYDSTRKLLFSARDRFGIKPVYYTVVNGHLMLASEIKAFLAYGWKPEWDVQSIREGGEWNDNRTAFRGVFKLPGGHQLLYSLAGQLKIQPYWEQKFPNSQTPDTRTVEEVIEGVRERLIDAVRVRLRSDVPLAIALSGGVDSSGVAGIATKILREKDPNAKVVTFTLAFPERKDLDEGPFAQRMAESIGAEVHMITPSEEDLANKFETAVVNSEMAVSAMHASGKYILSETVRKAGYKVLLTGEGADEVHGGYAYLLTDYLRSPDAAGASMGLELPTPAELEAILKVVEGTRPAQDQIPVSKMSYADHKLGRSMLGGISSHRVWGTKNTPENLFHPKSLETLPVADASTVIAENVRPEARNHMANGDWHPLNSALYVSSIAMLPLLLNQLGDRAEMASSVEGRQPYLDTALVEYMNNVPPSLKVRPFKDENGQWKFTEKWLLRQAVKPFITEEIFYRKKDQYNSPAIDRKGHSEVKKYTPIQALIDQHVDQEKVEKLGFLNWSAVKEILGGYLENPEYPQDGGLDKRARALLQISSYTILGNLFKVPTAVF